MKYKVTRSVYYPEPVGLSVQAKEFVASKFTINLGNLFLYNGDEQVAAFSPNNWDSVERV